MIGEMAIPVLPCVDLDETLSFYRALGFEITHEQKAPYVYAAVQRGGIHLHFYGREGMKAPKAEVLSRKSEEAFGACLLMVPEVEELHRTFAEALKKAYGKVPIAGLPRIARMRKGQSRFTVMDPSGNSLILIRHDERGKAKSPAQPPAPQSRLARAIRSAEHTRVFMNDDALAAEVLDEALSRDEAYPAIDRARALVARIELGIVLSETERVKTLRAELSAVVLSDEERERHRDELEAADELERSLG